MPDKLEVFAYRYLPVLTGPDRPTPVPSYRSLPLQTAPNSGGAPGASGGPQEPPAALPAAPQEPPAAPQELPAAPQEPPAAPQASGGPPVASGGPGFLGWNGVISLRRPPKLPAAPRNKFRPLRTQTYSWVPLGQPYLKSLNRS